MTSDPNENSAGIVQVRSGPLAVDSNPDNVVGITTSPKFATAVSHHTEMATK